MRRRPSAAIRSLPARSSTPSPSSPSISASTTPANSGWRTGGGHDGVLADEIGAGDVRLGRPGEARQAGGVDRRPQLHGAQQHGGDATRRRVLLLPFGAGEGGGRHHAGGTDSASRFYRRA